MFSQTIIKLFCDTVNISGMNHLKIPLHTEAIRSEGLLLLLLLIIIIIIITEELANDICAVWKQNAAKMMLIVISSTGVIPKLLSQSLKRLNLHPNTYIYRCKNL